MKITLLQVGKTHFPFVNEGFSQFEKRLKHYCRFHNEIVELSARLKSNDLETSKKNEASLLLKKIQPSDCVVLLDEKGKNMNSVSFATWLNKTSFAKSHIVFVIGGPYGFHKELYDRSDFSLSLSSMTFSHQLIRLIFAEQLYRAFSIIKGEPYHHE